MTKTVLYWILIVFSLCGFSKDLGVRGPVHPIVEQSLLELIFERLSARQAAGDFEVLNARWIKQIEMHMTRPSPVSGITPATQNRHWIFNPTWVVSQDIRDHQGRLIAAKGIRVNPLETVSLSKALIFINANSKTEMAFLQKKMASKKQLKIILVAGNIVEANKTLKTPVYFDQKGILCARLGIQHTPALVSQEYKYLVIREVVV
jgi:conjugal transfer pilus assembly protein TraW